MKISVSDADLRLLRVFRTVAELGGFTPAEAVLGIARSTISTHIAALETRLGLRLCERGRGGFALTEEGRTVYWEAGQVMAALDGFQARVGALHGGLTGRFTLALIDHITTLEGFDVPDLLRRFRQEAPNVQLTVLILSTEEMERRLLDGTVHAAILPQDKPVSGLSYHPLVAEQQALYCSASHPLFSVPDAEINLPLLQQQAHVGRTYLDAVRDRERTFNTDPQANANNLEASLVMILSGEYVALLPTQYAAPYVKDGHLRALRIDLTGRQQSFALAIRESKRPSAVLSKFLEVIS